MKNMERKTKSEITHKNKPEVVVKHINQLANINKDSNLLSRTKVLVLQNQLKHKFGYQLSKSSIHFLNLYCEYCKKLKQIINGQAKDNFKHPSFLAQFSRSHLEDHMSKIFMGIDILNKKIQKDNLQFGKMCLLTFFQLQNFREDNVVIFLSNKISEAKASSLIDFQQVRVNRSKKSLFHFEEKENKIKLTQNGESRKHIGDKFSKIHFQILALKVLINNNHPDPIQINKISQTIKTDLLNLFKRIKLNNLEAELNLRKKSILNRHDQRS